MTSHILMRNNKCSQGFAGVSPNLRVHAQARHYLSLPKELISSWMLLGSKTDTALEQGKTARPTLPTAV